jgi:hypothetical protein
MTPEAAASARIGQGRREQKVAQSM